MRRKAGVETVRRLRNDLVVRVMAGAGPIVPSVTATSGATAARVRPGHGAKVRTAIVTDLTMRGRALHEACADDPRHITTGGSVPRGSIAGPEPGGWGRGNGVSMGRHRSGRRTADQDRVSKGRGDRGDRGGLAAGVTGAAAFDTDETSTDDSIRADGAPVLVPGGANTGRKQAPAGRTAAVARAPVESAGIRGRSGR